MEIKNKRLSDIFPYEKNAKKHDKRQIDNVAKSIKAYGFVQPIVTDGDGVIVVGHCRALAAKKLGMKEVPCVCVDNLTPDQVNALRLVDNKTNESPWDLDLLTEELTEVDLTEFDFDWQKNDQEEREEIERAEIDFQEKISVIVDCSSEREAEKIFEKLQSEGYSCRVSTL